MADPVNISFALQDLKIVVEMMKAHQQITGDFATSALVTSLDTTLQANMNPNAPPTGGSDALDQSEQT